MVGNRLVIPFCLPSLWYDEIRSMVQEFRSDMMFFHLNCLTKIRNHSFFQVLS